MPEEYEKSEEELRPSAIQLSAFSHIHPCAPTQTQLLRHAKNLNSMKLTNLLTLTLLGVSSALLSLGSASAQILVANIGNTIGEYNSTNGAAISVPLVNDPGVSGPYGIAISGNTLFVANMGYHTIGEYNATTGAAINASFITGLSSPSSIALSGNILFVANMANSTIGEYEASTGDPINASFITGVSSPMDILISGNNLFVANATNNSIGEYTLSADGLSVTSSNSSFVTGLKGPHGLAVSGTNLFVANANNNTIGEYNATSGSAINASLVSGYVISPYGIAVSGTNLFVANYGNNTIGEFNATTGAVINASLVSGVTGPTSIAFLAVPEPSTYVLFGLGALMLVIGYRLRTA